MKELSPYEKEQALYKEEYYKKRKKYLLLIIVSVFLIALFFAIVPKEVRAVIYMMSLLPIAMMFAIGFSSRGYERDIRGEQEFLREIGEQCIDCDYNFVYATKTKKEAVNQMFGHSYRRCPKCEKKYGIYKQ